MIELVEASEFRVSLWKSFNRTRFPTCEIESFQSTFISEHPLGENSSLSLCVTDRFWGLWAVGVKTHVTASRAVCEQLLGSVEGSEEKHWRLIKEKSISFLYHLFFASFWLTSDHLKETNRVLIKRKVEATWTPAHRDLLNSNILCCLTHYTIHPADAVSHFCPLQWLMNAAASLGRILQRNFWSDVTAEAQIKVQEFIWDGADDVL